MVDTHLIKKLMGGNVEFVTYDLPIELAAPIIEECASEAKRLERIFSFYDPDSELSKLNKKRTRKVSNEMLLVIKTALKFSRLTNGNYDISLGKKFAARKSGKPLPETRCSYKNIVINGDVITLNHPDVLIDLGSIAKGYITDMIIEHMKKKGVLSGLVDARGDIKIFGKVSEKISIQHPRNEGSVEPLIIKNTAVATSGDYNQFDKTKDDSHIVGSKDLSSVTVVHPSLMIADALSTTLFVSSALDRKAIIDKHPKAAFLLIDKNDSVQSFNEFKNLQRAVNE